MKLSRENETIKVDLYAMVVPELTIPVFISHGFKRLENILSWSAMTSILFTLELLLSMESLLDLKNTGN